MNATFGGYRDEHRSKTERTQIAIRLANDLVEQIQKLAQREQRNRSNMIEYLLREKLREMQ